MPVQLKRIYETPAKTDGVRVLVDRVWPRGVTKQAAQVDEWLKELGPSNELRQWFNHEIARWPEFQTRYRAELSAQDQQARLQHLRQIASDGTLTLVYSAKDTDHNQAAVIAAQLA